MIHETEMHFVESFEKKIIKKRKFYKKEKMYKRKYQEKGTRAINRGHCYRNLLSRFVYCTAYLEIIIFFDISG